MQVNSRKVLNHPIQFHPEKCFASLANKIAEARREGDRDPNKQVIAMTQKLTGNSLYSATLLCKEKHRNVTYHTDEEVTIAINSPNFVHLDTVTPGIYEVQALKSKISHNLPLYVGVNVYLNAKLRMLEFFYDFFQKYIPKTHFELLESDTDSVYFSLAKESLEDCIPSELRRSYFTEVHKWLPAESCETHRHEYIKAKSSGKTWNKKPCCEARTKFDVRTPGLFKEEYSGSSCVALTCKTYFCQGDKNKQVSKGLSVKQNQFSLGDYEHVLTSKCSGSGLNRGFVCNKNQMFTYSQKRSGLSYFYGKRQVLEDGIHTIPLDV